MQLETAITVWHNYEKQKPLSLFLSLAHTHTLSLTHSLSAGDGDHGVAQLREAEAHDRRYLSQVPPETLNPNPQTLIPQPSTLVPPSTWNPHLIHTLHPEP